MKLCTLCNNYTTIRVISSDPKKYITASVPPYCKRQECASPVDGGPQDIRDARIEVCNDEMKQPQYWVLKQ